MRQRYTADEVIAELGGSSFMTKGGIVVEGNYQIGDKVLLIFDLGSRRYLPIFKKRQDNIALEFKWIDALTKVKYSCVVELLNVQLFVPPSEWFEEGIKPGEVEGVDYFKTYYNIITPCSPCTEDFTVCERDELSATCKPFYFYAPTVDYYHHPGHPELDDPKNHCVYSMNGT